MKKFPPIRQQIPTIAIESAGKEQRQRALLLAANLGLPEAEEGKHYDLILRCTDTGLELFRPDDPLLTGSIRAEFVAGPSGYRRNRGGSEMLIRAIGHKKNMETYVLDATGGLGRDAFVMAGRGCRVRIMERNPVVAALLEDGLHRASAHPETSTICRRISLVRGDSRNLLLDKNMEERFDIIYLDPMFPQRRKSARVKKEMQLLQQLAGPDEDIEELLALALRRAGRRVVVKRPREAPPLQGPKPAYNLGGKTTRFDVYPAVAGN